MGVWATVQILEMKGRIVCVLTMCLATCAYCIQLRGVGSEFTLDSKDIEKATLEGLAEAGLLP